MDSKSPEILVPKNVAVQVGCRGEQVLIKIGNTELPLLEWRESIRLGNEWLKEAKAATRDKRFTAVLSYGHHKLEMKPECLLQIAAWVISKGYQARRNSGNQDLNYDP